MRKNVLLALAVCGSSMFAIQDAAAQEEQTVIQEDITVGELIECKDQYYSTFKDNWFIQLGAGMEIPFVENFLSDSNNQKRHITAAYNVGFGKWFSPYFGWRMSFVGGAMHYDTGVYSKAKYINGNLDIMWDMLNSFSVKQDRFFSIIPFIGVGGTFAWDYTGGYNNFNENGTAKKNEWVLPVSAGLQLRFRLNKYVDLFAEGRAQFLADNFNRYTAGDPIDVNSHVLAGVNINLGGRGFKTYNPCNYLTHIAELNNQVNDMRAELAECGTRLNAAEAQLPCPEVKKEAPVVKQVATPLMSTVRFRINSARISDQEMVNIYNTAEWMKANPDQKVVITGYADKNTGSAAYNMKLSQRRAEAVQKVLVDKYGISKDRLSVKANGSDVQPYETNNWNRIVIFTAD